MTGTEAWAAALLAVHAGGDRVETLAGLDGDDQAYAVQHAVAARLGGPVGYKLSFTLDDPPPEGLAVAPAYGALLAEQVVPAGTRLSLEGGPLVESEILVRPRTRIAPGLTPEEIARQVDVAPGLELPVSRFRCWWPEGGAPRISRPEFIADACLARYVVVGGSWVAAEGLRLDETDVTLTCPDGSVRTGRADVVMGHPLRAVGWLADALGGIPAGAILATGTVTEPVRATAGVYAADFAGLGRVEVSLGDPVT